MANIDKNQIGYNENTTYNPLMVQYKRAVAAPLDISEVFTSKDEALAYAQSDPIAFAGQIISVAGDGIESKAYEITSGGTLVEFVTSDNVTSQIEDVKKIITENEKTTSAALNKIKDTIIPEQIEAKAVLYDKQQELSVEQKEQARENIDISVTIGQSDTTVALEGNTAGLFGFYFSYIDSEKKEIYLSEINSEIEVTPGLGDNYLIEDFENPYTVGDIASIHDNYNFYNIGKIATINGNKVVVDSLPENVPFADDSGNKKYYFYVLEKPLVGKIDFGKYSSAIGLETKATNLAAHAEGTLTHAYGRYSHAEGGNTKAGYAAHAEGNGAEANGEASHAENAGVANGQNSHAEGGSKAVGNASHAEGWDCEAAGEGSHAEGYATSANGKQSHAEGVYTQTKNQGEHAEGKFNLSETNAIHSVGVGTSTTNRLNAHLITSDGKNYIKGIGGYDGYNHESSSDLADVVSNIKGDKSVIFNYGESSSIVQQKLENFFNNLQKTNAYIKYIGALVPASVMPDYICGVVTTIDSGHPLGTADSLLKIGFVNNAWYAGIMMDRLTETEIDNAIK